MDPEIIRKYCLKKKAATESFPFGNDTLVFKVMGKIFLLLALDSDPLQFNVKCDPELAETYRDQYTSVIPAFHMNKKHWNSVLLNGNVPARLVWEMIDASYDLVVASLPLRDRKELGNYK
jgi:predicted DNA-binding protein (MmcQ/YjbR family)